MLIQHRAADRHGDLTRALAPMIRAAKAMLAHHGRATTAQADTPVRAGGVSKAGADALAAAILRHVLRAEIGDALARSRPCRERSHLAALMPEAALVNREIATCHPSRSRFLIKLT